MVQRSEGVLLLRGAIASTDVARIPTEPLSSSGRQTGVFFSPAQRSQQWCQLVGPPCLSGIPRQSWFSSQSLPLFQQEPGRASCDLVRDVSQNFRACSI